MPALALLAWLLATTFSCHSVFAAALPSSAPVDETWVQTFSARREALLRDGKINVPEMSQAIRAAINEGEKLAGAGDIAGAQARLQVLAKYGPIDELPSFDLLMLEAFLALQRGDKAQQAVLLARAGAMREILWNRIGSGSESDPVRVVMVNEISEWARSHLGKILESKPVVSGGRSLQAVSYSGSVDGGAQSRTVYFFIDPRYMAMMPKPSLYAVVPAPTAEMQRLTALAKEKRDRFLDDPDLHFLTLQTMVHDKVALALQQAQAGKPADGLATLREIETIRPIEDIPNPTLLSAYSTLLGLTGDSAGQTRIRQLLFGTFQAIAASGDALTAETGIEVIFVEEEYAWLRDKGLTSLRQQLVRGPQHTLDVLHARDAQGNERDYYFNITRMAVKEQQSIARHE